MEYINNLKNKIDNSNIIDNSFIYDCWKEYIDHFDLSSECSSIGFDDKSIGDGLASYSFNQRKVIFNLDLIKEFVFYSAKKYNLKGYEYYCYVNLKILEIILHEFEHIIQEKKSYLEPDNLEIELVSWCKTNMKLWELNNNKYIYDDTYKFNPCERLAELYSYKNILEIIKTFDNDVSRIVSLLDKELSYIQLRGYNYKRNVICPTENYFMCTGLEPIWYNMDFYSSKRDKMLQNVQNKYNFDERILFGLPISKEELKKIMKKTFVRK